MKLMIKLVFGLFLIGIFIFLPAGTLSFWNGWLFFAVVMFPILIAGKFLQKKSPQLLAKRLDNKEKLTSQKWIVGASGLMFIVGFICCGLSYRYGWGRVPDFVSIIASVFYVSCYLLYLETMRENPYLFRTVTVCENQRVIDRGMYGVVRHPMYAVTVFLFFFIPFILGSWVAFFIFLCYPVIIVIRILEEEKFLLTNLEGYSAYQKQVKYRLIPFIW